MLKIDLIYIPNMDRFYNECFLVLIFTLLSFTSYYRINNRCTKTEKVINVSSNQYQFIWNEFEGSLGDLKGDDIIVYGSSFGPYHNYEEIKNKLHTANQTFPEIIDMFSIGKTYFGREIYCVRITNESCLEKKTEMLVIGQHHAREQITVENSLYFMDKLINGSIYGDEDIEIILNNKQIFIIPSLNIDGAKLIDKFLWQRKNARPLDADGDGIEDEFYGGNHVIEASDVNGDGYVDAYYEEETERIYNTISFEGVDLDHDGKIGEDPPGGVDPNRNYPLGFGNPLGSSTIPNSDVTCGAYPFSENCTARLRDFVDKHDFKLAVSLHSGLKAIFLPNNVSSHPQNSTDSSLYRYVALNLTRITGYRHYYSSDTAGQWVHWMYWRRNSTTIAVNIECYYNESAFYIEEISSSNILRFRGMWDKNNPAANQVMKNCEKIYQALLYMAQTTFFQKPDEILPTIGIKTILPVEFAILIVGIALCLRGIHKRAIIKFIGLILKILLFTK